jgi:hypothetical protein
MTRFFICLVLCLTCSYTAVAQTEKPVRVIVDPFTGGTGYRHDELTLLAEKIFRSELLKGSRYEPIAEEEVSKAAGRLGLSQPYERQSFVRLASELRATHIVSGEIAFEKYEGYSEFGTIEVGIKVRMRDIAAYDLVNGAACIGQVNMYASNITCQYRDSFRRATILSAADCADMMTGFTVPEGIILNTASGSVISILVNIGSRNGLALGDELRVLRDGRAVGKLRISRVFPTDSEVEIVENFQGIRPTDTVRFIFPESRLALPGFKVGEEKSLRPPYSRYGIWD